MKGQVHRRGSTWSYRFDIDPDPLTGRRRQTSKGGFRTEREAWQECRSAMRDYERGRFVRVRRDRVLRALRAARQVAGAGSDARGEGGARGLRRARSRLVTAVRGDSDLPDNQINRERCVAQPVGLDAPTVTSTLFVDDRPAESVTVTVSGYVPAPG